jgi:hypothetical protein
MPADYRIHAEVGSRINVRDLGLNIYVDLNDDGQPTIAINTEEMPAEYVYNERTGLPGTAEPYTYETESVASYEGAGQLSVGVVFGPSGEIVARHYEDDGVSARLAAAAHCRMLNTDWHTRCGMPDVQVLMGDAILYDSEDHNPDLRERRARARQEA